MKKNTSARGPSTKSLKRPLDVCEAQSKWHLRLYVAGATGKSATALRNLKTICDEHLLEDYEIQIIDLLVNPQLAKGDQILAIPTLIKKVPAPFRKIIGDLSNFEKVIVGLDLKRR